jgi:hypothetical protein
MENTEPVNPLSPDAPIIHLLSLKHNPLLKSMSQEELIELVKKLRTHSTSAPTLSAKLKSDGEALGQKAKKVSLAAKRRALLDEL